MNNPFQQVKEFHKAFGHEYNEQPTEINSDDALKRAVWTGEELVEFLYASVGGYQGKFEDIYEELLDGLDKAKEDTIMKNQDVSNKVVAQADALTDVSYFNYGTFAMLGVEPQPLFDIVQQANMSKLWDDGKPHYREEDGKVMKPEGWQPPEPKIEAEIKRQSEEE